jgi:hypothetical protein
LTIRVSISRTGGISCSNVSGARERPYEAIGEGIERLVEAVEGAAVRSPLRDGPDRDLLDDLVARTYRASVLEAG